MGLAVKRECAAFVCSHVFENTRPVLLVCRADGDWQFLCGGEHDAAELPQVIGLEHLLERDPTLDELRDLEDEWEAERASQTSLWYRRRS